MKRLAKNFIDLLFGQERRIQWTIRAMHQVSRLHFQLNHLFHTKKKQVHFGQIQPVFIVGCGHSGTSLLNKILGTHPSIFAIGGESELFLPQRLSFHQVEDRSIEWMSAANDEHATHICEKTPQHIHKAQQIRAFFPTAKFIYITRNPLDCVASLHKRYNNFERSIFRYQFDNHVGLRLRRRNDVIQVKYESLVIDFDRTMAKVMDFLKLPIVDLSRFHETETRYDSDTIARPAEYNSQTHSNMRNWQVNQPVYDTRGSHSKILTKDEIELCSSRLHRIAEDLGYEL